jgi:hypothetical protein
MSICESLPIEGCSPKPVIGKPFEPTHAQVFALVRKGEAGTLVLFQCVTSSAE